MKMNKTTINIKLEAEQTDYLREFLFKNINARRKIRNYFVEKFNEYHDIHGTYEGIPAYDIQKEYHDMQTKDGIYKEICVGMSEAVIKDLITAMNTIKTENKKAREIDSDAKPIRFKFQKRDNYHGSFRLHNKVCKLNGRVQSRIRKMSSDSITFRVRGQKNGLKKEYIDIYFKEKIYDDYDDQTNTYIRYYKEHGRKHECRFRREDIRQTTFIHELGKIYILLTIKAYYCIDKNEIKSRKYEKAGIDTGIHNPFMIYDGEKFYSLRMSDKKSNKIHYLERKSRRLQSIMDMKVDYNKMIGIYPYSKKYEKTKKKLRKIEKRISNIKRDWAYNTCKFLVTNYKCIIVDRFSIPKNDNENLPKSVQHKLNYTNRFHRMFYTNEILVHMANKYGCKYVKAPEFTTCRCSECGKINDHLPLTQRMFKCKKCGYTDDRDINASKNCYNYI